MDINQAQSLIRDTLESSFDKNRFTNFIKNLLNNIEESTFTYQGNKIRDAYRDYIKTLERIGKFSDDEKSIDILIITLQKETSLERARTMQRSFVAWYLVNSESGEMKDAALAAFVSPNENDWRFSLIKMEYQFEKTKSGNMKIKEEFTPAKRWSFLVGPNEKSHTAQSQLISILANDEQAPTFEELEKAFDIETVSKEYFVKYRELFLQTKEGLDKVVKKDKRIKADFEAHNIDTVNFVKKLLGQIVFLYFLQKKGWFGVGRDDDWGTGSKNFLRELFDKKHGDYNNFFNDILEPLFYEALRIDRSHDDGYFSKFDCKIPFLNGGLFDPIGNYDWARTDIVIPNRLFSNAFITKEGDIGNGMLDVFDRYNFTVKEDEPLEKEVAIDPELLGKVYEKFNAIRPDNFDEYKKALNSGKKGEENKFNKKFGVYYTPREIVHYMCQQSLINYLLTELDGKVTKEEIEKLVHFGEQVGENEARVEREGRETKTYSYKLPENIRKNAELIDEKLKIITICDPAVGSGAFPVGMMSEIVKTRTVLSVFLNGSDRSVYKFKHQCIENSLYGVDIDPGAVEIAKLRLWLSLIVDEEDIKNIKPLPNLDYKIICGNSLIGVERDLLNDNLFKDLEKLKPSYFNETNPTKKQDYKKQIDELISQITNRHTEFDFEVYFSEVFHNKGGFGVVLANPPYIRIHKQVQNKKIKEYLKKTYTSAYKDFDYYVLFIEKGLNILKEDGILTYITPDKYLVREYGSKIRSLILRYSIVELFDISRATDIFEAATYPLISIIQKNNNLDVVTTKHARTIKNLTDQYKEVIIPKQRCIDDDRIEIIEPDAHKLLDKIYTQSSKLSDILETDQLFCGTPRAKDYHSWAKYVFDSKKSTKCLRVLNCSNLQPYVITHKKKIRTVGLTVFAPYFCNEDHIISETRWSNFSSKPKILIRGNDTRITAVLDEKGSVFIGVYGIKIYSNIVDDYKYLLALLNSELYQWIFSVQNSSIKIGGEFFSINSPHILKLPFKKISNNQRGLFSELVDKIHIISKDDDYLENQVKQANVHVNEKQIDQLIYKLYGLTPEEIKIVEGT